MVPELVAKQPFQCSTDLFTELITEFFLKLSSDLLLDGACNATLSELLDV